MDWVNAFMDGLIGTIIGAGAGLIGVVLTNVFTDWRGYKKISAKIGKVDNTTLSGQHTNMEKNLSRQHESIEKNITNSARTTAEIKQILLLEQEKQSNRYSNLDEHQKEIKQHVEGVQDLLKDWERLNSQNKEMTGKVDSLERQYQQLQWKFDDLTEKYKDLKEINRDLSMENRQFKNMQHNHDQEHPHHGIPPLSL